MKKYKHLFFDLDRTLWDYVSNAREVLTDLHRKYHLSKHDITIDDFFKVFDKYNELLWAKYGHGKIKKETLRDQRFYLTLKEFGLHDDDLVKKLSIEYIELSPYKTNLFPEVVETLEYLHKKYHLHILTNGFNEVQFQKLINSGIRHFFEKIITSDDSGYQKPNVKIFEYALTSVNARKKESLMIGDDWDLDVMGAKAYGFDQVYFNYYRKVHDGTATFEITNIGELMGIL